MIIFIILHIKIKRIFNLIFCDYNFYIKKKLFKFIINVKKTLNKIFDINIYFEIYEYKYEIIYVNKFFFEYLIDNKTFFLIVNIKYAIN